MNEKLDNKNKCIHKINKNKSIKKKIEKYNYENKYNFKKIMKNKIVKQNCIKTLS